MVGNKPNFEEEDVIRTFFLINDKPISRQELVKKLNLGEGTIRTILEILKNKKLIESNNQGHILSKKGLITKNGLLKKITKPKKLSLEVYKLEGYKDLKSCGILIKKPGDIKIGFQLRDEAIRRGTYGAIIFRYEHILKIPQSEINFKKEYKKDYENLIKTFDFEENSILIVTFDKDYKTCENATLAVAKKIKNINL